jgi:predicted DNA-binding transcriptional regulator YafY
VRASRLVSLLLLLQHRGRATAQDLADELEVSVRTIYRDVEALGAAGVPVYTEPGHNGGIQLVDGYRTRLTGLTQKEAEALFAAGVPGPVGQLGLGTVLGAAQLKLLAALPKDLADRAALAQQRFHVDAPAWYRADRNDPHLADLTTAVWEDRRLSMRYRRAGEDEPSVREVDPFGLVCKAGTWYLVARRDGDLRTYRVSRVHDVTLLDEQFERPAGFALASYWNESVAEFEAVVPDTHVEVVTNPRGAAEIDWYVRSGGRAFLDHEVDDDGTLHATVAFESLDEAFVDLLRLGADVEVLAPIGLRDRLRATAAAIVEVYSRRSGDATF